VRSSASLINCFGANDVKKFLVANDFVTEGPSTVGRRASRETFVHGRVHYGNRSIFLIARHDAEAARRAMENVILVGMERVKLALSR